MMNSSSDRLISIFEISDFSVQTIEEVWPLFIGRIANGPPGKTAPQLSFGGAACALH